MNIICNQTVWEHVFQLKNLQELATEDNNLKHRSFSKNTSNLLAAKELIYQNVPLTRFQVRIIFAKAPHREVAK